MRQYEPPSGTGADLDDPETDEIRVEIEQTRTEMSGTLDAIQRRLAPEVLTEQAKDLARDATDHAKTAAQEILEQAVQDVKDAAIDITEHAVHEVKDAAREVTGEAKDAAWDATVGRAEEAVSSAGESARGIKSMVIETIKQHPIPAALAGLSLFWLYRHRTAGPPSSTGSAASGAYRTPGTYGAPSTQYAYTPRMGYGSQAEREAGTSHAPLASMPSSTGRSTAPGDRSTADHGMVSSVTDTVSAAASHAGETASDVLSNAGQFASDTASSAGRMASSTGEGAMDVGTTVLELVKQNPVPAALVGIGLGWLYMNRSTGQPAYRSQNGNQYRYSSSSSAAASVGGSGLGDVARQASDMARQAGERASGMAGDVQDQAGELADTVQEQVGEFTDAVMERTTRAPGQIQQMMEENPLLTGALAAVLGGAVGLALPSTRTEDQLVGATRDRAMGRAQDMTSEAMDKVQNVAKEVQTTASKEAQNQGLTV
jgi:ElaB/YqjD/DUF883 family membrane-anchored ribosome-binding protein